MGTWGDFAVSPAGLSSTIKIGYIRHVLNVVKDSRISHQKTKYFAVKAAFINSTIKTENIVYAQNVKKNFQTSNPKIGYFAVKLVQIKIGSIKNP